MGDFAKFGLDRVDIMLSGGAPRGSVILVEEVSEELSSFPGGYLCCKFLYEGLGNGEAGVLILTEHTPTWYLTETASLGMDLRPHRASGLLKIMDAFTSLSGSAAAEKGEETDIVVKSPSYPSEFTSKLLELYGKLDKRISRTRTIVDSLSVSIYMMGFNEVWKLMLSLIAQSNTSGHTGLLIVYPQMHEPQQVAALERIVDGIVEFRGERVKSSIDYTFRVKKMRGTNYNSETVRYFKVGESIAFE